MTNILIFTNIINYTYFISISLILHTYTYLKKVLNNNTKGVRNL